MARAGRLSAAGIARRRAATLGACLDLCRDPRTRPLWPHRIAPGPHFRPDLSAQLWRQARRAPRRRTERMNGSADQLRLLEALLFAAPAPLSETELAERIGLEADVPGLLQELSANYAERGVHVVRLAGGWTFRTAPDLAPFLVSERPVARKLSRAARCRAHAGDPGRLALYPLLRHAGHRARPRRRERGARDGIAAGARKAAGHGAMAWRRDCGADRHGRRCRSCARPWRGRPDDQFPGRLPAPRDDPASHRDLHRP